MISDKRKLSKLCEKYNIKLLLLHGSYALGKERDDSDIDIAYLANEKELDIKSFFALQHEIHDLVGAEKNLDFHSIHKTDPLFQYKISQNAKLLYGNEDSFNDFKLHSFVKYHDQKSIRELEKKLIIKQQEAWHAR